MTELIKHPEFGTIKTQMVYGEPWFCAKDVCRALGHTDHINALKRHCRRGGDETTPPSDRRKGVIKCDIPTASGSQEMLFIDEGNLYRLIIKSHLPSAEKFEAWVCDEVLPAIRKTGGYKVSSPVATSATVGRKRRIPVGVEIINFLWLIDEHLMHGDKKMIALEIGVSERAICGVLSGQYRSPRILMALYQRALENKRTGLLDPYNREFVERAVCELAQL